MRIAPTAKQDKFIRCPDRFPALIGGIGSGKSWAGAARATLESAGPPTVGLVVAPTYRMLRDATLRSYYEVAGDLFRDFQRGEMIARIGNAEVMFRSADNPDRLRGPNLDWAHIDEAALCPKDTWPVVIGRLRGHGNAGPCWITTTPKGRNWVYHRLDQMTPFTITTRQNPHLHPEFVKSLEQAYTGRFAEQELEGKFVGFEGLVYEEFDAAMHVRRDHAPFVDIVMAMDVGYANPTALYAIGVSGNGSWHVFIEAYRRRMLDDDILEAVQEVQAMARRELAPNMLRELEDAGQLELWLPDLFVDPAAAALIAKLQQAGIRAWPADNRVMDGIRAVKSKMNTMTHTGRPLLTISPECPNLLAELESYHWKESVSGYLDQPVKENDHAVDAVRYGVMGEQAVEVPEEGIYVYDERVNISPI